MRYLKYIVLLLIVVVFSDDIAAQRRSRRRATPRRSVRHYGGNHHQQRIAQFEREGGIDSTTVVMLGNSLTENGKDWGARIGTTRKIVNRGIIGDNTIGMANRLYQITPYHPKAIFLMAGINDLAGDITSEQVAQRVITLIEKIREESPQTKLFVQSLLPIDETDGRWKTLSGRTDDIPFANMYIKAYCESHHITFIDLFHRMTRGHSNQLRAELSGDGLHITEQGYRIWAFELKKYINRL